MTKILHFTIGPVHSFVGQARRTRDLWAGSFLLSWLAGQAMAETIRQGGYIDFPVVKQENGEISDPLLYAIENQGKGTPQIGTLPNRFKALFDDTANCDIAKVVQHVQDKWCELSKAVRTRFVDELLMHGNSTKTIWDNQIKNFWEINWVMGEEDGSQSDGIWLDQRKNWRNHWPMEQQGDHCTLMGDWQEISGHIRSQNKAQQDEFWTKLQETVGPLDLREGERLCAIALVKRLFPKLSRDALNDTIGWVPGGKPESAGNWPSTAYMSAIPWLTHINDTQPQSLQDYAEKIRHTLDANTFARLASERATHIEDLDKLGKQVASLDGNLFHLDALNNHRATPLSETIEKNPLNDPDKDKRETLLKALHHLGKDQLGGNDAQPFYALLVMDGDNMGKQLQDPRFKNEQISQALLRFASRAREIVHKYQGVLIYAGGDDVLAMVSMTKAIDCARALHTIYCSAFREESDLAKHLDQFTVSAAVVYAHYNAPLRTVIHQAHHTLDNIAKQQNLRNSLALTVLKSESVNTQWVGSFNSLAKNMSSLVEQFMVDDCYSTSFIYNLETRYPILHDLNYGVANAEDKTAFVTAEYCKGRPPHKSELDLENTQCAVNCLLQACATQTGNQQEINLDDHLQLDAANIARFIVDTGFRFGRRKGENYNA